MRVDCDQDAVWIRVEQAGAGACHTGRRSCFYRAVPLGSRPAPSTLEFRDAEELRPASRIRREEAIQRPIGP